MSEVTYQQEYEDPITDDRQQVPVEGDETVED